MADGDVNMVDSFWFSPTGQPGPCQTVTHRAEAEDVRMEIDLTGDDDVVDQGMSQLFLGTESEQSLPAEKYGSVARALHDTFSRNFTSTLNSFSPTSLIQNSPQVQVRNPYTFSLKEMRALFFNFLSIADNSTQQSIPDTIANGIHTHRGSETNPDNHNTEFDQVGQSLNTLLQVLTMLQTICEPAFTDPTLERLNGAGQVS